MRTSRDSQRVEDGEKASHTVRWEWKITEVKASLLESDTTLEVGPVDTL